MTRPLLDRYREALRVSGITPPADRPATTGAAILSAARTPERELGFADLDAYLVESRVLGEAVWLAPDDVTAERLERELRAEGDCRLVFTVAEVLALAGMLEADRRSLLAALARIKRAMPGAVLDGVTGPAEMVQ